MGREQFSNTVKCEWLPDDPRKIRILERIEFTDPAGKVWVVLPESIVNGADIPEFLWDEVGSPYVGFYRRPTVFHDVYCQNHFRPSTEVHRMFYDAMIADGVKPAKAWVMYKAVLLGGPDWD